MVTGDRLSAIMCLVVGLMVATPGCVSAQPPQFPDLSHFTETDVSGIRRNNQTGAFASASFNTPDGLHCNASTSTGGCWASGPAAIPGFPEDAPSWPPNSVQQCPSQAVVFDANPGRFRTQTNCSGGSSPVLPVGQKVTVGTVVCAVGDDDLTACTNGVHGFVVQTAGSWTF